MRLGELCGWLAGVAGVAAVLFFVWYIWLGFNVGLHAVSNNLQCDKPLTTFVLVHTSLAVLGYVLQVAHAVW